ncbi:MAG: YigZ family protein [Clostridia bacterium]|nr:YigZ family protein [Clostridia bacterium]
MEHITVVGESTGEYAEKHSRFLGFITPCSGQDDAAAIIFEKRKKYWDARHIAYAYVLADGTVRFSDDGEPHGTAGKPILDVLSTSGIRNAVVIVVRYFGGILLGTGGLVRAYTLAAQAAIENARKAVVLTGNKYSVTVDYSDYDRLLFLLKKFNGEIVSTDFSEKISVEFTIKNDLTEPFFEKINKTFSSSVVPEFVEKSEIREII